MAGREGDEALLLLHGFPSSSADFQGPFLERLRFKYSRIIALDYPGVGHPQNK
jgi:pimeloyl-ACP methyl ester carboxylesterase